MIILLSIILILVIIVFLYIRQDKFGKAAAGERLARIKGSANFKNGKFQNLSETPTLAEGYTMRGVMYNQLFKKASRRHPAGDIPSIKTDLLHLPIDKDILVWFGHSSYFLQLDGKRILVDPVFSGNASPIPGTNKPFKGSDIYGVEDLPEIDYLLITHDHYDHLDYPTITLLRNKVKTVICGLGTGAHLEYWGYEPSKIIEMDWYERTEPDKGFVIHATPARHFSGRSFSRNVTLWVSFVVQTPSHKIFLGGDSGYDAHFVEIGNKFGPFDLAILDNGQYDLAWRYIHALPEEVLQAAKDLKAKHLFPVHSGKFVMANHAWDEPLKRIAELNKISPIPLLTPLIGEPVILKDETQAFKQWWLDI